MIGDYCDDHTLIVVMIIVMMILIKLDSHNSIERF